MWISIHASAKEATIFRDRNDWDTLNFNPRLREGGDRVPLLRLNNLQKISIHASAKEATLEYIYYINSENISIHASAKEATATYCDTSAIMYISSLNNFFVHYF